MKLSSLIMSRSPEVVETIVKRILTDIFTSLLSWEEILGLIRADVQITDIAARSH